MRSRTHTWTRRLLPRLAFGMVAVFIFTGCIFPGSGGGPASTPAAVVCPWRVVYEMVDATGSQDEDMVKTNASSARELVGHAATGCDEWLAGVLDEQVFRPDTVDDRLPLPASPVPIGCVPAGPFSSDDDFEACEEGNAAVVGAFYQRFETALASYDPFEGLVPGGRTPLFGALAAACSILNTYDTAAVRVVIAYSDFASTSGDEADLGECENVHVVALVSVETREQFEEIADSLIKHLSSAASVRLLHAGTPAEAVAAVLPPGLPLPQSPEDEQVQGDQRW